MEFRPGMVTSETSKATAEERAAWFNPNDISAYRKSFNAKFKPVPPPTRLQRIVNWFRRFFA